MVDGVIGARRARQRRLVLSGLSLSLLLGVVLVVLSVAAVPASAELRTAAQSDPQDQTPSLENEPSPSDIEQVRISYDSGGTLALTMRFFRSVPASSIYNVSWTVEAGTAGGGCSYSSAQGARVHGFTGVSDTNYASMSVSGYTGSMAATRLLSADRRELTIQATHATLANRDFRCASAQTSFPDKYGHCGNRDCTYFAYSYTADDVPSFYFDGFAPTPAPPPVPTSSGAGSPTPRGPTAQCDDGQDNDGDGDTDYILDDDCDSRSDDSEASPPEPQCSDGKDNDADGQKDEEDWGCDSQEDNDERLTHVPTLTSTDARQFAKKALRAKYGRAFTSNKAYKRTCVPISRSRFQCRVSWLASAGRYSGIVKVWQTRSGEEVMWHTKVRVKRRG